MKSLLLPLLVTVLLALACPFSGKIGTGSQVKALLADPQVGLDQLDNYRSELTISFAGKQDGQPLNLTDTYTQTEWKSPAAKFTSIDSLNENGQRQVTMVGSAGEAQYFQPDSPAPCLVTWGSPAGGPTTFRISFLLPAVGAAQLSGEETLGGIASRHYTFDTASFSLPAGATAKGEAWIATDGGYVLKYILDISGADPFFGMGITGSRHVEYRLSEIGAHPQVVFPQGCDPVLDWPVMDDASDLTRLPGLLDYSTAATAENVFTFYEGELAGQGWALRTKPEPGTNSPTAIYVRAETGASAIIAVYQEGTSQRVNVMAPDQEAGVVATAVPGAQETAVGQNPSVRVSLALSILFNMMPSQPGPDSYHLEVAHQIPAWDGVQIAHSQESMSADVEAGKVHFTQTKTPAGRTTSTFEAYLVDKQEYVVKNGQVQPPAPDSLTWMLWSTNLVSILSSSASGASATGTEVVAGRSAQVYALNSPGLTIPGLPGTLGSISSLTGQVWVDDGTGALLKAVIDYQADVSDNSGTVRGSGSGHLEITVSQLGQVTVSLPGQ
jgi:hypothetical protein